MSRSDEEELRSEYYTRTASRYADLHEHENSAHNRALTLLEGLLPALGVGSLLDVGTGTGRALRFFRERLPSLNLAGVEPVEELVRQAIAHGLPEGMIQVAGGERLPFADSSVDVVTSFGVLHHVPAPEKVLSEMLRVARRAVFVSDSNRFAQGRPNARYLKLALCASGLWPVFDWIRTGGRRYMVSEGDGIYYSYSVFDSMRLLRSQSSQIMTFELERAAVPAGFWHGTLCNASTILVGALK